MRPWAIVMGMGLLTYSLRVVPIALLERVAIPRIIERALRFVAPAVLSAIIVPALLRPAGPIELSLGNVRILAGVLAALVAWRTKNMLLTIAVGMAALWIVRMLIR